MAGDFRKLFWHPPRAHGEIIEDRAVSFLELFYDLVYVVVVSRAAHTLAEDVSWRGVGDFAVIFGLIWIGWLNGSIYYDLHGREDGRTRTLVFAQMLLLALLAVYTSHAATDTGEEFALVYTIFLVFLTYLWYTVRRQDSEEYGPLTARYLAGMSVATIAVGTSVFLEPTARLWVWGGTVVFFFTFSMWTTHASEGRYPRGLTGTDAMVERFGLFTIIVLGEVVVGVVNGLAGSDRTPVAVVTGMLGLMIGFAFWWSYFDFAGRRRPVESRPVVAAWMAAHLPLTMSIAAIGAALVSMVEHAGDDHTPVGTAWLIAGAVALGLVSLTLVMRTLSDWERFPTLFGPVSSLLLLTAVVALAIGFWQPAAWLMAMTLVAVLTTVWFSAFFLWMRLEEPESALPG